jgi:hypothetical protein
MLESLSLERCEPHVGSTFVLDPDGDPVELTLVEASPIVPHETASDASGRRAFSLLFRGPSGLVVEQRIWTLEHPQLGRLDLFLVPMQPDREGSYLEAVFT